MLSGDDTEIERILKLFAYGDVPNEKVIDPDYCISITKEVYSFVKQGAMKLIVENEDGTVIVSREEWTCAYIFGEKEGLAPFLRDLPLYS